MDSQIKYLPHFLFESGKETGDFIFYDQINKLYVHSQILMYHVQFFYNFLKGPFRENKFEVLDIASIEPLIYGVYMCEIPNIVYQLDGDHLMTLNFNKKSYNLSMDQIIGYLDYATQWGIKKECDNIKTNLLSSIDSDRNIIPYEMYFTIFPYIDDNNIKTQILQKMAKHLSDGLKYDILDIWWSELWQEFLKFLAIPNKIYFHHEDILVKLFKETNKLIMQNHDSKKEIIVSFISRLTNLLEYGFLDFERIIYIEPLSSIMFSPIQKSYLSIYLVSGSKATGRNCMKLVECRPEKTVFFLVEKIGKFIEQREQEIIARFNRKFKEGKEIIILNKNYTIKSISFNGNSVKKIYPKIRYSIDLGEKIDCERGTVIYYQKYINN